MPLQHPSPSLEAEQTVRATGLLLPVAVSRMALNFNGEPARLHPIRALVTDVRRRQQSILSGQREQVAHSPPTQRRSVGHTPLAKQAVCGRELLPLLHVAIITSSRILNMPIRLLPVVLRCPGSSTRWSTLHRMELRECVK